MARPIAVPLTTTSLIVVDVNAADKIGLWGWSIREAATTAAAAVVRVRAGGITGDIVGTIRLAASASDQMAFGTEVDIRGDLYMELVSGTAVEASFYVS